MSTGTTFKIVNRTKAQLRAMVSPQSVGGGNLQAIPYVLFDSQLLTSGTTQQMNFFQSVQADKTLGNMWSGGMLPVDTWLEIEWMWVYPQIRPDSVTTGMIGAWGDYDVAMIEERPTHTLTIQDKEYGQIPASFFGQEGGQGGFGYNEAAAGVVHQDYVTHGQGRGFWVGGQIIIPPQAGFLAQIRFAGIVTTASARDFRITVGYQGTLHRPIL